MKAVDSRKVKLHYKYVPRLHKDIAVPWLNLSGRWLADAGFDIGDMVAVKVEKNTLTVTRIGKARQVKIL